MRKVHDASRIPRQLGLSSEETAKLEAKRRQDMLDMAEQRRKDFRVLAVTILNMICLAILCAALAFWGVRQIAVALLF